MFTSNKKLEKLRNKDKCLAIWIWHEETMARLQARCLDRKKELAKTTIKTSSK